MLDQPVLKPDTNNLLNTMSEAAFAVDTDKKVIFANRAMKRLLFPEIGGLVDLKMIQERLNETILLPNNVAALQWVFSKRESGTHYETLLRDSKGRPVPMWVQVDLLLNENDEVIGALEILRSLAPVSAEVETERGSIGFRSIIGRSKKLLEVLDLVASAATSQATVLLEGESGTGKELIARAIHQMGPRRDKPFIALNCASLPDELLGSELFGHIKGAFTSAIYDRPGRFELADHGTLFLDEIGDMSHGAQAKLLRVLQEHEFERVGGNKTVRVDVRIIAATNKDLSRAVKEGTFREDLYYRIRVFPIRVPPLRERKEDIFPLIKHFMLKFSRETGKQITNISPKALEHLLADNYPGNIRELENRIEHAFVTCPGPTLLIEHLPKPISSLLIEEGQTLPTGKEGALAEQTRELILKTLEGTHWNQSQAAKLLGISRSTLWRRLKNLGVKPPKANLLRSRLALF